MPKVQVKAAVLERSRRSTAGKRMASLVGKAQEDDDTFWSHSIWSEAGGGFSDKKSSRKRQRGEDDSSSSSSSTSSEGEGDDDDSISDGEGSYRMSEDDSDAAVDQFDSDFDESETDDEDGADGDGEEEQELRAEERRDKATKRKKNQRLGVPLKSSSAGRELIKRKGGAKMTKRGPLGEGWNEGLVLNWPPPSSSTVQPAVAKIGVVPNHSQIQSSNSKLAAQGTQSSASMPDAVCQTQPQHTSQSAGTKEIATKLPPSPIKSNLNTASIPATATSSSTQPPLAKEPKQKRQTVKQQRQAVTTERKKSQRRQFTQEELILESIKSTETDNAKWLSARKRSKEEAAQLEKATVAKKSSLNQKPISRFHSRRGCVNTLTFMDMDHLPEILTRKQTTPLSSFRSNVASPKRRRVNSTTSETSESAHTTTNAEARTSCEKKCVITGKVARYKDPKTKQYYHDLDAYKELQRRLESGEIKIPQPRAVAVPKNNTRKRKSDNGSNAKPNGLRGGNANVTNVAANVAFASDQPTMVAEMASNPSVKVTVTQNGIPVSPPSSAQKVPMENEIPAEDNRNGHPTPPDRVEFEKATKTEEHEHIHNNKAANANAKSDVVSATPPIDTRSTETQPQPSPKNVDFENGLQDDQKQPQIAKDAVDDKNKNMASNETQPQPVKQPTIEAK